MCQFSGNGSAAVEVSIIMQPRGSPSKVQNTSVINITTNLAAAFIKVFCNTYPKPKRCVLESLPDSLNPYRTNVENRVSS